MAIHAFKLSLLIVLLTILSGCIIGVRQQQLSDAMNYDSTIVDMKGSAQALEFGATADFRYFRLSVPFQGLALKLGLDPQSDFLATDIESSRELSTYRLDIPLISLWSENHAGIRYPGRMVHRKSVEIWTTAGIDPGRSHHYWWSDIGLVYYHHNAVAIRLYGGYGEVPFQTQMQDMRTSQVIINRWDSKAGGFVMGLEITLSAGEHALDFLIFLFDEDKRQRGLGDQWKSLFSCR